MEVQRSASYERSSACPGHNVFTVGEVTFDSNFDNGNLGRVERYHALNSLPRNFRVLSVRKLMSSSRVRRGECENEFLLWTAQDNAGTPFESKHCSWFYFRISGPLAGKRVRLVSFFAACGNG